MDSRFSKVYYAVEQSSILRLTLANTELTDQAFEELFGEAVVSGMTNVLGTSGEQATIKHLGLGPSPTDPDKIDAGLVPIFGKSGAVVIERQIIRALFEKLDERFIEGSSTNFKQKVEEVRRKFEPMGREGA